MVCLRLNLCSYTVTFCIIFFKFVARVRAIVCSGWVISDFTHHKNMIQKIFDVSAPLGLHVHVLTVNGSVCSASTWRPMTTLTMGICFNARTRTLQVSRSQACVHRWFHDLCCGTSISRSPSDLCLNISYTACLIFLSDPSRRMCPTQASRLARIHLTMSKLRHFGDASWWGVGSLARYDTHHLDVHPVYLLYCLQVDLPRFWTIHHNVYVRRKLTLL